MNGVCTELSMEGWARIWIIALSRDERGWVYLNGDANGFELTMKSVAGILKCVQLHL